MKTIFLFISFLFFTQFLQASPPDWNVNPSEYSYNMTITCAINIDYEESTDSNDMIAAFVGDECRGVAQPVFRSSVNRYLCYLMVYSNSPNDTLSFKVYDASADEIKNIEKKIPFEVNGIIGNLEAPYISSNPTLSNESKILSFSIPNQQTETVIDSFDISLEMPYGSDLTSLVAEYTTSHLATVKVGDQEQESGVTANDFSNPVVYWVLSADETDTSWYTVNVKWFNNAPTGLSLSDTVINETYQKGAFIGYFTTEDRDKTDIHEYTLVKGAGDTDNYRFLIDGNKLYLNEDVYFETVTSFSIRVKTSDGKGGTFERQLIINVEYLDRDEVRASKIISPNGDGLFDTWKIQNAGLYYDSEIFILNSLGETIFHSIGYDTEWDGTYEGKKLPIGAYYYIIKKDGKIFKGTISLIR